MTEQPQTIEAVTLDGDSLTPEAVAAVARHDAAVSVSEDALERVRTGRDRIEAVVESGEAVYGVTTGFGELVTERIPPEERTTLQQNLVRSHAAGAGRTLTTEELRAMLVCRVNSLLGGHSGVRERVLTQLVDLLNERIHPVVRSRGSLGASGDLAPLAHVALLTIGEGEAIVDGERMSGAAALEQASMEPLTLQAKEGLALLNGTQLSAGLGALVVVDCERALAAADLAGGLTTEVTMGTTANCSAAIQDVRPQSGQARSAQNVRAVTADSEIVESHRNCESVQDAYSIRCLPQVHGAVRAAVGHLREAIEVELDAATDNPLVFAREALDERSSGTADAAVVSGGNFHGAPLAHRLDYVTGALADLASICERRVDRLLNPAVQESHLPAFLTPNSGVQSGYMLAQYTAAAHGNEVRSLGRPGVDSVPVSGNQEDHVSMSAQSAFHARTAIDRVLTVVAIELLCGVQASEFVDDDLAHGRGTQIASEVIREVVPPLDADRPVHEDIQAVDALVRSGMLGERVRDACPGLV